MRLLTATQIVDRTNLHPVNQYTTTFTEDGASYAFTVTRTPKGIQASLAGAGVQDPFTAPPLDPEATPTQQAQRLAEWIVFVVDMNTVIRQLTNA